MRLAAFVLAGAALASATSSGPQPFDGGELVSAAWRLGGSHPPGQPLHALLAHALCLLPVGPVEARTALLSVFGTLASGVLAARLVRTLLLLLRERPSLGLRLCADAASLALLLSPPLLRQATRTEVYSIALALTLASVHELFAWLHHGRTATLYRAALAAGLAAALHPPHALCAALIGAAVLTGRGLGRLPKAGTVAWTSMSGVLSALASYSYLPIRAAAGAPMWGEPSTASGLWMYISGAAYRHNLGAGEALSAANLLHVLLYVALVSGVTPLLGTAVILGSWQRKRLPPGLGRTLLLICGLPLVAGALQPLASHVPDNVAYLGPATAMLIVVGAAGLGALLSRRPRMTPIVAIALATLALNLPNLGQAHRSLESDLPVLDTLGLALLATPPARALVVAESDFTAATWMMHKDISGARPDVAVVVPGLITSTWHWRTLATHPLFDGRPVKGPGTTNRARYLAGAIERARGGVAIASEGGERREAIVAGPYLVSFPTPPANSDGTGVSGQASFDVAERLAALVGLELAQGPTGDTDTAGAIVRNHVVARARWLTQRNQGQRALAELRRALFFLPSDQVALLGKAGPLRSERPPVVRQARTFLMGREDTVREAAVLLFRLSARRQAYALLQAQLERGDPRALLQLGWLKLADRDEPGARGALQAFLRVGGDLTHEVQALQQAFSGP